jgi:hypothetical protein
MRSVTLDSRLEYFSKFCAKLRKWECYKRWEKNIEAYSLYSPSHCYQYIINEPRIERENKLSPFDFATKISEHL